MKLQAIEVERQIVLRKIEALVKETYTGKNKDNYIYIFRMFKCQGNDVWIDGNRVSYRFK